MTAIATQEIHAPRGAYVQFPVNYWVRTDIRRVFRQFPHTTDWLMAVCCVAKDARSNGVLTVAGSPVTPSEIDIVPCWKPIEEAWVHAMVAEGLFSLDPTGAVVVECRSQFIQYWSDTKEAKAARQAAARANKRCPESQLVTACHEPVTESHDCVTACHEMSRECHSMSRLVTARHDTCQISQVNPSQVNPDQFNANQINPSQAGPEASEEGAMEGFSSIGSVLSEPLDEISIRAAAFTAVQGMQAKPRPEERLSALLPEWSKRRQAELPGCNTDDLCAAIVHGGHSTAWAQRHGPEEIKLPGRYLLASAKRILPQIFDRRLTRLEANRRGLPDPGPLPWVEPDKENL